jgi:hypothetical protein
MRKVLALLVVMCGVVSIAMTARYGWKQADNEVDQAMSAVMYGTISLCAIIFDGLAIMLWVLGWRRSGAFIALIACIAFVVTFSNSLGSITVRFDAVEAQRTNIADTRADNRRELSRLEAELTAIGAYQPTDDAAVDAAKGEAATATQHRIAECGGNNEKRGPNCKLREADEFTAIAKLASTTASKATTDRAAKIETQIAAVKSALGSAQNVGVANPLAKALSNIVPWVNGDAIASRMQGIIALVFELCIVGMMIGFEAMGHVARASSKPDQTSDQHEPSDLKIMPPPGPKLVASITVVVGSVQRILTDNLENGKGSRVEIADTARRYREVCRREGKRSVTQDEFVEQLEIFCNSIGIKLKSVRGHVYLMDVQLTRLDAQNRIAWPSLMSPLPSTDS